jgi:hypothetical protein
MSEGRLKVINLFGAAGIGKSGCASGLFSLMKSAHLSVQLVTEVAKDMLLSGQEWRLSDDQLGIFALQQFEQLVLQGKYEYAITDSPLLLSSFYGKKHYPDSFYSLVRETFNEYENLNFFLRRDLDSAAPFETEGRAQDRLASRDIQETMPVFLKNQGITFRTLEVREDLTSWELLEAVKPGLKRPPVFDRTPFDVSFA